MTHAADRAGAAFPGAEKASTAQPTRVPCLGFHEIVSRATRVVVAIICVLAGHGLRAAEPLLPALHVQTVADGVHVVLAPSFDVRADNAGFVTNIGVVEDVRGLVLIGTGTSHRFARHLQTFVEARFGKPVIAAVDLYGGGDHVLGNGFFVSRGVPVAAHVETDRFIRASCHSCVERLTAALGENMMSSTHPTPATTVFRESGYLSGVTRRLRLLHYGHTFQPGATALLDEASGTLFAGELASLRYLPDLYNAQAHGWRDALERLAALAPRRVVPSHGAVGGREAIDLSRAYLDALITQVDAWFEQGVSLLESLEKVEAVGFNDWYGYSVWHRRNVHFVYLHREQAEFGAPAAGSAGPLEGQH